MPRELWIQYADKDAYPAGEKKELLDLLKTSDGNDTVIIYLGRDARKRFCRATGMCGAGEALVTTLSEMLGEEERQGGGEAAGKISS